MNLAAVTHPADGARGVCAYRSGVADPLIPYVAWIGPLLQRPLPDAFAPDSPAHAVLTELREGWGIVDTADLLGGLTDRYGELAQATVSRFLEFHIRRDWAETGLREAHEGTEVDDFIRLLWNPLEDVGFEYTSAGDATDRRFCVTRCPVRDAAVATGMQSWMYALACATDLPSATSFSPHIEFRRTRTLMQGDTSCDHRYLRTP